ncbi:MAG: response regulator [Chitinophagaceae bacterium]|jgi:class 3 adenylate cyclase|nr:response regulator [Chitinophagaceae bacterium]
MIKILVADDEADLELLIKQKFRKQIREQLYEFVFAPNGVQALKMVEDQADIELVLSDINMPEMDGLTLLTRLSETKPLLKTVIISAYGDMENIRTAMNRGAFDFLTKPIDFTDLDLTLDKTLKHLRQIKETIRAIRENNILRMYVDENVLNFMSSREAEASLTANETIEATVVFIDICSFTSISEHAKPDIVVTLLNKYFDVMVKQVINQKGHVDKFIGDAIMAVFRGDFHLDRAMEACLAIRSEIDKLPREAEADNFAPHVSIGLNSGEMISGNIGSASLKRLDYTVIGDTVNTAQRLQSAAKPGQVIIGENTYEKVKESFKCNFVGEVMLKNKQSPAKIYEVLD